jgi:hypothetical protein
MRNFRGIHLKVFNDSAEYGITEHKAGEYEVDHLIPLSIGGSSKVSHSCC